MRAEENLLSLHPRKVKTYKLPSQSWLLTQFVRFVKFACKFVKTVNSNTYSRSFCVYRWHIRNNVLSLNLLLLFLFENEAFGYEIICNKFDAPVKQFKYTQTLLNNIPNRETVHFYGKNMYIP